MSWLICPKDEKMSVDAYTMEFHKVCALRCLGNLKNFGLYRYLL